MPNFFQTVGREHKINKTTALTAFTVPGPVCYNTSISLLYPTKIKQAIDRIDLLRRDGPGHRYCLSQAPGPTMSPCTLGNTGSRFNSVCKEPGHTLLPMSEHLTELKKRHPGTLVISIFHTLVCMCFMSQQRLISPTHCHRIILCDKAQSETPTK